MAPFTLLGTGADYYLGDGCFSYYEPGVLTLSTYSLQTGQLIWAQTLPNASPFDSLGARAIIANGTIYLWGYGGNVYAYNLADGSLKWQYNTPSGGLESPYGTEPLWVFQCGTVADGKLFVPEGHMYSPPLFHNAQQLALNLTDGSVVWSIDAFDVTSGPAISDGVMTAFNAYDNQIYGYGEGPSKTTVTAPSVGVTTSTPITISGTVIDISAGTQQEAPAANFPNGVPAVSDASQSAWMEYVYMQQPCPANVTGVPVTINVVDANGNYRSIGTTTSNIYGTYSLTWTPDIAGDYTVIATFAGSESYYSSSASTAFHASEPAPTASPVPTAAPSMSDQYFLPSVAAIIVVVIIGFVVLALLMLRKKP